MSKKVRGSFQMEETTKIRINKQASKEGRTFNNMLEQLALRALQAINNKPVKA